MATKRPSAREKRADLVFAAEDPYRNIVRLERDTWEGHILAKHDDLPSDITKDALKEIIEKPDRIRISTSDADMAAFERDDLRALVLYETETSYIKETTHRRGMGRKKP